MSQVVRNANRVATTINVVKIVLLAFNAIAGVILVVNGAVGSQQQSINSLTGEIETSHAAAVYLIIGGLATLVLGSLLIYVLLGWFEHVLRTLAALVENTQPVMVGTPDLPPIANTGPAF
ncbi:hypothetical protein GCM10009744_34670 [Kribbella alba]|uniref:MotA/TolQ/ExbB proton channel domain-containing protein n=1 Tax=Kribbella alba TaxID=190197 RepID=A0ABN2FDD2_9ACTN